MTLSEIENLGLQNTTSTSSFGVALSHNARAMRESIARPGLLRYSIPIEDLRLRQPPQNPLTAVQYHQTEPRNSPIRPPLDITMSDA
ncbi:hypothetical protein GGR55DRAFT_628260 [Xylaria sp. FL0064]|nr:hypothetical protein GGR55DRAFT_628260 [Xylaria sp. FL0064]